MKSRRKRSVERKRVTTAAPAGGETRRELRWAAGLALLAWVHRLAFLLSNEDRDWGFSIFYEGDAERFFEYARALLAGTAYDGGIPFHPPAFPVFLAGLYTLLGVDQAGAVPHLRLKILLSFIASLPVGLIYLLVRPYLGRAAAILTAGLCLYSFGLYIVAVSPVSEGLYLLLLLLSLLLWSRGLAHPLAAPRVPHPGNTPPRAPLAGLTLGVLLGILALTRAEGVLIAVLLAATGFWGVAARRLKRAPVTGAASFGREMFPWVLVLAGWVLVVSPWTVRNHSRLTEFNRQAADRLAEPLPTFVPITAYGPLNLALANNAAADGSFSRQALPATNSRSALSLFDPTHLHLFLHGDAVAWEFIRAHPTAFTRLVMRKWSLTFGALKLGWTQWDLPGGLRGIRRPVDLFVPDSPAACWLSTPLILLGLILCLRRGGAQRRWAGVTLLLTGHTLVVTGAFFGYARLGVLMLPLWFALAAIGSGQIFSWIMRGRGHGTARRSAGMRLVAAIGLLLLLAAVGGAVGTRRYKAAGSMLPGAGYLNPDAALHIEVVSGSPAGTNRR